MGSEFDWTEERLEHVEELAGEARDLILCMGMDPELSHALQRAAQWGYGLAKCRMEELEEGLATCARNWGWWHEDEPPIVARLPSAAQEVVRRVGKGEQARWKEQTDGR